MLCLPYQIGQKDHESVPPNQNHLRRLCAQLPVTIKPIKPMTSANPNISMVCLFCNPMPVTVPKRNQSRSSAPFRMRTAMHAHVI